MGDRVYIQSGSKQAMITCFDATSGQPLWTAEGDQSGYSSPAAGTLGGVEQIIAVGGTEMYGFRASDGKKLWSVPWATQFQGNIATPLIIGDYVFISSAYAKGCALFRITPESGSPNDDAQCSVTQVYFRTGKVMQNHHSNCVHKNGFLYGYDGDNLRCVDLRKGQQVPDWLGRNAENRTLPKGCLILVNDQLIGLTQTGDLFFAAANPEEFELITLVPNVLTGPTAWALPIVADQILYLRDDRKIVAYDLR